MARIVIITHLYDDFENRDYLLGRLAGFWTDAGHRVLLATEPGAWPSGDVAVLHVDLSVIPAAYAEASRHYAVVVNGAARDIRKRLVSGHLVRPHDGWTGPVIVKTDLNCGGMPELRLGRTLQPHEPQADAPLDETMYMEHPYPILTSSAAVSEAVWNNPGLVVERFLPERDRRGFWMRAWVFFGDRERCTRYLGSHPVVKSGDILAREPAPVPEELRSERARLGFDYGKFDFVVRDGNAILLDANRTPWAPPLPLSPDVAASNVNLARGLDAFL